jgi:hypothetical protein
MKRRRSAEAVGWGSGPVVVVDRYSDYSRLGPGDGFEASERGWIAATLQEAYAKATR